jgi:hypothetical protein
MATFADVGITNDLLTSTLQDMRGPAVETLFKKSLVLDHAQKHGGVLRIPGSSFIVRPLSVTEHSTITALSQSGFDPINMTVSDVLQPATYSWADFVAPIAISRTEELANRGEYAVVNLLQTRLSSVMGLLQRELEKQLLAGSSATLAHVNTLNGGTASGGTGANKFLVRETGVTGGTIGGLARSVSVGLDNIVVDASGLTTVEALTRAYIQSQERSINGKTNLIVAGSGAFESYKSELFAVERFASKDQLDAGRLSLMFNDAVVEYSSWMPATDEFYGIDFSGIKIAIDPDADFQITDFKNYDSQLARGAFCHVRLQLIADHLASQFAIYDIT